MNIFFLDTDPARAARMHNDRHCVKMILESAQMLSTVAHENGHDTEYDPCFRHHPCVQWAGRSRDNFDWLRVLALALNEEFKYRFQNDSDHASAQVISGLSRPALPRRGVTPPAQAMPDSCKRECPVRAYRVYYQEEKDHLASWTRRDPPEFYE